MRRRPARNNPFGALAHDARDAWRALRSSPGYAAWVSGSLAIGMAVTIAALALLNAMLALPFPGVTDQHRLVRVAVSRNCGPPDCWIRMSSPADYASLGASLTGLQGLAALTHGDLAVTLPDARSSRATFTSANYFDVVGVRPALGRTFHAADAGAHAAVAVISYAAWMRELGGDPSAVGRSIRVADRFVQIVGVAPEGFTGTDRIRPGNRAPDLWLPMWMADSTLPLTAADKRRGHRDIYFIGRLEDGVGVRELQAQAEVAARRLAAASGDSAARARADVRRVWRVNPESWHVGVMVVMPIPLLVLAIACVNAANLMLARGSQRRREIAVRLAIGAGRARIVRQLLAESAALVFLATAIAVPLAWAGLRIARSPIGLPIPFDPTVLALTILTAAATTLAFGLAPALRVSAERPSSTLGSARDAAPRESRLRRALVGAQVALSLGLLATAWQLVSTVRAQAVSGGTPAHQLLIARFDLEPNQLGPGRGDAFYRDVLAGATRLAGVEAAGLARHTAVWTFGRGAEPASVVVWQAQDAPDAGRVTIGGYAGGALFDAVGLRTLAGRGFTDADRQARPQVAVVNRTFAETMGGPAVGSALRVAPRGAAFEASIEVRVVGIIEAAAEPRLTGDGPPAPKVYLPAPIEPEPALALYVRTRSRANALGQPLRELVGRIAPAIPVLEAGSLEDLNERSYDQQLWLARAAALLGILGLLLATAGLYGVSSYVVALRSREIAIRMAVGARPRAILRMILAQSMRVALAGLVCGGAAAAVASRVIQSEYHGIRGLDAAAFGGSAALFLAAMLVAGAVPAVRASRLNPVESLKDA